MPADRRALLFDLDDTLYPMRRFVLSGFGAIAARLEAELGVPACRTLRTLIGARREQPGREIQHLLRTLGLAETQVPALVSVIREHEPRLRLPRGSAAALGALRGGWRVGIVTNGNPAIQQRKLQALGLGRLVQTVVFADAVGSRQGKPDPVPFELALARLGVRAQHAVFVGNDEWRDIAGASRLGMCTILAARHGGGASVATAADATVHSIADVPVVAARLMEARSA